MQVFHRLLSHLFQHALRTAQNKMGKSDVTVIDNNELRVSILLQPAKTLEFVVAQFIVTKTGVSLEEIEFTIEGNFTEMKVVQSVDEDYLNEVYNDEFKHAITVKQNSILTIICK